MTGTTHHRSGGQRWVRIAITCILTFFLVIGGFYAWRVSPGYAVYRIKQALETHDYALFSRYVDVDQVFDHTLDEFGSGRTDDLNGRSGGGLLDKLLRKGVAKLLAGEAREVSRAAFSIVLEQAVTDQTRQPPYIPPFASLAAWWLAQRDGDTAQLYFEAKNKPIQITLQRTPTGEWRVIAISNLQVFLPRLEKHLSRDRENLQ